MTRLIRALGLALALALPLAPGASRAQDADPNAAIERVIADQLAAFARDDFAAAFAHAAPGIQARFGSPAGFGRMVRQGYPMIYRPARVEWRALETTAGGAQVKTVLFEDAKGRLFEVDYLMGRTDGAWRIRGVQLRRLPGLAS
ncbi:hypothetical protein LNKW23_34390 [Paralimibaculum aggregatum]|uniref:DUF4864 domain-containing protein n=1 Tax=Paralimibaculum aggregatum TaxID=3036245 RepID=A0ABQ6LRP5_9RHOB|nr:DUF4864 domain-containing protein [Limibaculum sp. NKW23]GMG84224.1 hypothetical protein LNKW23_34390 [Limibaculum sp. NKW23]